MTETFDVAVIGAGLIGLASARALLAKERRSLIVLEAEDRLAPHQSGHNSGVIHSGLYYRPGSLKARLCGVGRTALERYCGERGIAWERCGKVVVATEASELPALDELERRGRENGLEGIERLGPEGLREHEPHVVGIAGLFVPQTGIVDYVAVARAYAEDVARLGGEVRLEAPARSIYPRSDGFVIGTPRGELRATRLLNCAGAQADRVARRAGMVPKVRIVPFRGEYKLLRPERAHLVRNLIYPVPDARFPFLGVHFTRRIDGGIEAGPNAVLALSRDGYRWKDVSLRDLASMASYSGFWIMGARYWRTAVGELRRSLSSSAFTRALQRLLPDLTQEDLLPGGSGVRAQALGPSGRLLDDFHLESGPGSVHVLCAPSPAATASLAIGEAIAQRAEAVFAGASAG